MARRVTVAIVDDHPVAIEGLRSWIDNDPDQRAIVVASGSSIESVLADQQTPADVIMLDLELGDVLVTDRIGELCADGHRVVAYSHHDDPRTILAVIEAGGTFLAKHESREHCVEHILAAASDRPYVTPAEAGAMLAGEPSQRPILSDRERTALLLWFQSMSKASVARRMGISEATVKQYIDRARVKYARTGRVTSTKTALLARAIEDGLIRPDEVGEYRPHTTGLA